MSDKYNFYGHDDGLVISGPDTGFASRPMTLAELAARDPAKAISEDIYRHANYAGVCYHEIWGIIAKAIQGALSAWQPIETAPMDGTEILTLRDATVSTHAVAFWSDHGGVHGWAICGSNVRLLRVTHWMPLPAPPSQDAVSTESK